MFTVFVIFLLFGYSLTECPPPEVSAPCKCDASLYSIPDIICKIINGTQLKTVLHRISNYVKYKHFRRLLITYVTSEEIPGDVTGNLTFLFIGINFDLGIPMGGSNKQLKRIHWQAFRGTSNTVESFYIRHVPNLIINLVSPYNIIDLVNSFPKLIVLDLNMPVLSNISKEAFRLPKLRSFWLNGITERWPRTSAVAETNQIGLTIDDEAFYNLKNLRLLNLGNNRINYLSSNSLRLQSLSPEIFHIYLSINNLNSSSFAKNSLSQFNRNTFLTLNDNQIDFLDQNVFQPFLEANAYNFIDSIESNPLNCSDCRNYWLIKDQVKYKSRVSFAYCDGKVGGPKLFDKKFDHCKNITLS